MNVYRSLNDMSYPSPVTVSIGTFDGVHLGHRAIVQKLLDCASRHDGEALVVTFDPHPREIVGRGPVQYLTTIEERLKLLSELGVRETLVLPFTHELSRLSPGEFYEDHLIRVLDVAEVVVGYDHMFGRDRVGGFNELQSIGARLGFRATAVSPVTVEQEIVSSSRIRQLLSEGKGESASKLLGRTYSLEATVVHGDGRGASLGFPTANLQPCAVQKIVPASGVYFVRLTIAMQEYFGMLNIGSRPTFHADGQSVIEVHLFDFQNDLYDRTVEIHFLKSLRAERKFSSVDELIAQLQHDRLTCQKFINEIHHITQ